MRRRLIVRSFSQELNRGIKFLNFGILSIISRTAPFVIHHSKEKKEPEETVRYTEEGLQVPVGNGGSTKRYKWTQTLEECTVMLGVPKGIRAKELDVSIKTSSIHVKTKEKAA